MTAVFNQFPVKHAFNRTSVFTLVALFLLFLSMMLGDLPWQERLGTLTRSPMVFIAPIIGATILIRRSTLGRQEKLYGLYWLLGTLWSFAMLGFFLLSGGNLIYHGRNLLLQIFMTGAESLIFFFAFLALHYAFRTLSLQTLWFTSLLFFFLLCLIGMFELVGKEQFQYFHSTVADEPGSRLRLLTTEPSQAFPVFTGFYFLTLILGQAIRKSKVFLAFLTAIFVVLFMNITSKGGIPILAISLLAPLALLRKSNKRLAVVGLCVVLPIMTLAMLVLVQATDLRQSIEDFTSFGTRLTGATSALVSLVNFPLGTGYGTFWVHYPPILKDTIIQLQSTVPIPLNFDEVINIMDTQRALSAKAGIPTQVIYNGVMALIFYFLVFRRAWNRSNWLTPRPMLAYFTRASLLFMLLTLMFAADMNTLYVYLLPIVLLEQAPKLLEAKR